MKIEGIFVKTLPEVTGETQKGIWVRGGFVIETLGEYPKKVAFTTFGEERVAMANSLMAGQHVEVYFQPESREFGEKWYTDLRATSVKPLATTYGHPAASAQPAAPAPQAQYPYAAQAVQTPTTPYLAPEPVQQTMEIPAEDEGKLPF